MAGCPRAARHRSLSRVRSSWVGRTQHRGGQSPGCWKAVFSNPQGCEAFEGTKKAAPTSRGDVSEGCFYKGDVRRKRQDPHARHRRRWSVAVGDGGPQTQSLGKREPATSPNRQRDTDAHHSEHDTQHRACTSTGVTRVTVHAWSAAVS